jgi:protein phosphatase
VTVLRAAVASDVGRVRAINQDSVFASATVFAVADGMGGHAGGEVASSSAIEVLERSIGTVGTREGLIDALKAANQAIAEASTSDAALSGMGTTIVAASLISSESDDVLVIANVGDSRAYLFRQDQLSQITSDHSVAGELLTGGSVSEEEAAIHPQRHVITRALGIAGEVDVDLFEVHLTQGDRVLLCSDGLSDEVSNEEIARVLFSSIDPTDAAEDLVRRANANGGIDNISVVVIDVVVPPKHDDEPTQANAIVTATVAPPAPPKSSDEIVAPEGQEGKKEGWYARRRRLGVPRILTARVLIFIILIGAVIYGGWYFVRWYATSSYYVKSSGTQILIYQGQPGGVLWFKPKLVEVAPATTADVLPIRLPALALSVSEPSLDAAKNYVRNLACEFQLVSKPTCVYPPTPVPVTVPTTTPAASMPASMRRFSAEL